MPTLTASQVKQVGTLLRYKEDLLLVIAKQKDALIVIDSFGKQKQLSPDTIVEVVADPQTVLHLLKPMYPRGQVEVPLDVFIELGKLEKVAAMGIVELAHYINLHQAANWVENNPEKYNTGLFRGFTPIKET